jgi:hypothetical protein
MSDQNQVQFVAFSAINQFMLDDYRQQVIHLVLSSLDQLSPERRAQITNQVKRNIKLHGFRNSAAAPLAIKVKGGIGAFERHNDFVAQFLMAWSELHIELRQHIYDLLVERGWEVLPPDTDRTKLPGFLVNWKKEETYDILDAAFAQKYPEAKEHEYDVRLMIVWVSGRLPFEMDETEE